MNARAATAFAAVALAASAASVSAQSKIGTSLAQFLLIEPSARAAAMGNAGAGFAGGLDAVYYNPAAIAGIDGFRALVAHSEWLAGIDHSYVVAGFPLWSLGMGYASITALDSGDMLVRTVDRPLGTGELFDVNDIAVAAGFGRQVTDRVRLGAQLTFMQENIWHSAASAWSLSFGTAYRFAENGPQLGASVSNFGTDAQFDGRDLRIRYDQNPDVYGDNNQLPAELFTDDFAIPVVFRVGMAVPMRAGERGELEFALDALHPSDNEESVNLGAEFRYGRALAFRAGWQGLFLDDAEVGLTAGGGLHGTVGGLDGRIDYAWADHGRLGSTHRFSLQANF